MKKMHLRKPSAPPTSIRGTISQPIPLSTSLDDEFPLGTAGTTPDADAAKMPENGVAVAAKRGSALSTTTASAGPGGPRKQSTLRAALGKLFGKKKDGGTRGSSAAGAKTHTHHTSDPTALKRMGMGMGMGAGAHDMEPKRSTSMPMTEYDRALRSHSVGPDDMVAIESVRNSLHGEMSFSRRRATTANAHVPSFPRARESVVTGLSPRPASTHARTSRLVNMESADDGEIGQAITSEGDEVQPRVTRRRSRSVSELRYGPEVDARRRSDEIRWWRQSYDPAFMSPLSSDLPEADEPPSATSDSVPQPFNFSAQDDGMKITDAATLSSRVATLETRVHRLEKVVTQLCHAKTPRAETPPQRPLSTATIRGAASLPLLPKVSTDHYATLLSLIQTERAERQDLASQLVTLSRRFALSNTDIPSPENKTFSECSVFEDDDAKPQNDDDDDDETYSEDFATPREGQTPLYGAFGEELRADDGGYVGKKAARTLSLSQLAPALGRV